MALYSGIIGEGSHQIGRRFNSKETDDGKSIGPAYQTTPSKLQPSH
jgi:hypothetical protein